jgi:D-aminoacyl-tRNA deacylase
MRAVIQRVSHAEVEVEGKKVGQIAQGLLILLGVEEEDDSEDIHWLASKIALMRIFGDCDCKMNLSVQDINGHCLVISQFTLHASTKKGNRPSFIKAAKAEKANELYEEFCKLLSGIIGKEVEKGIFAADMKVSLLNDGPVTILIDSKNRE